MDPDRDKPDGDVNKTALSGVSAKDWMKKLEAATGKPLELGGTPHTSGVGTPASMEQRTIQFRCAETGKPFFVLFTKRSPSHDFQLVSVSKTPDIACGACEQHTSRKQDHREKSFDASDFDWTGWFCPHCGHKETFVQCGKCREYVCGRRVRHLQDGTETFTCHDSCGGTGKIQGEIESYNASQGHTAAPNQPMLDRLSSTTKAFPQATRRLLPPDNARG